MNEWFHIVHSFCDPFSVLVGFSCNFLYFYSSSGARIEVLLQNQDYIAVAVRMVTNKWMELLTPDKPSLCFPPKKRGSYEIKRWGEVEK